MAKLLLTYTVLDEAYANGKFWFFQGGDGKPSNIELPQDTGLLGIIGPMDSDPVVHSYMGGANLNEPRALVSVISNDPSQETAKYSIGIPAIPEEPGAPLVWTAGTQDLKLVSSDKPSLPLIGNPDGVALLIPCIGGPQNFGTTNGASSTLRRVPAFDSFTNDNSIAALTGDPSSATLSPAGSYDIKSAAASEDGLVYLLTEAEDDNFNTWWKLYKTTSAAVLGSTGTAIPDATNNNVLEQLDSGIGSKGYDWNLMYENADPASKGRLWFVKGTPIQASQGNDYNTKLVFDMGALYPPNSSDPLDTISYKNVNSADLIGEMIHQYSRGRSIDTRLVKGASAKPAR